MRTITGIAISLSFIAFGAAGGCNGFKTEPEPVGWAEQPLLSFDEARSLVQAECKGTYGTTGNCVSCVARAVAGLLQQRMVTGQNVHGIVSSFAHNECRSGCVPTSCAIETKNCGSIDNGCGSELACGDCADGATCVDGVCQTLGRDRVRCFCGDGSLIDICADVDCSSQPAHIEICLPTCSNRGGLSATGCIAEDPICDCGGSCPAGEFCVGGVCQPPQPGTSMLTCSCNSGTSTTVCVDIDCSGIAQDVVCGPICADDGGLAGTGCLLDACGG